MKIDEELNSNENKAWVKTSSELECVKTMPNLKHGSPGKPFDANESEVIQWLFQQPGVRSYLFALVNGNVNKRQKLIKFNYENKTWQGIDYED